MAIIIRQLWQSIETSSKHTKAYIKTQMQLHDLGLNRTTKSIQKAQESSRKLARQGGFHLTTDRQTDSLYLSTIS